ncbi:MAG TPA: hexose kinase [Streptosporangiaceae bacterium]
MIVTVTLNIALDVTYRVAALSPGRSIRVNAVDQRAGGKGVNVARVLHGMGHEVTVVGFAGGVYGGTVTADLMAEQLPGDLVPIAGQTRRTVTVVDAAGEATVLLEPGPVIAPSEWAGLVTRVARLAPRADVVVLSGSLPPGVPEDAYAQLVSTVRSAGAPAILDTSGGALSRGLAGRPSVVKPNLDELVAATPGQDWAPGWLGIAQRADRLRAAGAEAVVASLGRDGMIATTPGGWWHARLPAPHEVRGNPTGAGDAAVAALAAGIAARCSWPELLADAVALSAAAVRHDLAGSVDSAVYQDLLGHVQVAEIDAGG